MHSCTTSITARNILLKYKDKNFKKLQHKTEQSHKQCMCTSPVKGTSYITVEHCTTDTTPAHIIQQVFHSKTYLEHISFCSDWCVTQQIKKDENNFKPYISIKFGEIFRVNFTHKCNSFFLLQISQQQRSSMKLQGFCNWTATEQTVSNNCYLTVIKQFSTMYKTRSQQAENDISHYVSIIIRQPTSQSKSQVERMWMEQKAL